MKKTIFNLIGDKIQSVRINSDYIQLITESAIININNPITIYALDGGSEKGFKDIIRKEITNIEYNSKFFILLELEKIGFKISLLDEDYTGPEAGSLNYFSGEIIIFE